MKKYSYSKIGAFHTNHNEDSYTITEIEDHKWLIAVMDGCSMGVESHFASTLITKILRKIGKELSYKSFIEKTRKNTSQYLESILSQLFYELKQIQDLLHLDNLEILSTLILGVLDEQEKVVELVTIGDGLIYCDGIFYEYDQEDKPDYLGYHLTEDFSTWFKIQSQKLSLKNVSNLSISSDGIFTFKNFTGKQYPIIEDHEILAYLLIAEGSKDQETMLNKKVIEIETKYGLKPSDDLTIIRIIME
ncbi:MAG: protein phosphatase 2C domain-containing protein [Saprospiraceae bacterium]